MVRPGGAALDRGVEGEVIHRGHADDTGSGRCSGPLAAGSTRTGAPSRMAGRSSRITGSEPSIGAQDPSPGAAR